MLGRGGRMDFRADRASRRAPPTASVRMEAVRRPDPCQPPHRMEFLLVLTALAAGLLVVLRLRSGVSPGNLEILLAGACSMLWLAGFTAMRPRPDPLAGKIPAALAPAEDLQERFVGSASCRSCHPGEHASWRGSYHSSMTQPATPATVLGDFTVGELSDRGRITRFWQKDDTFWVETADPLWDFLSRNPKARSRIPDQPPRLTAQVVMLTGSHHLQTYWIRRPAGEDTWWRPDDGAYQQLPWVWLVEEGRWIPTQDSFVTPATHKVLPGLQWNTSCNQCHSVGTRPHLANDRFDTRTADLGIACEACHGPGAAHVAANRSPLRRYLQHLDGEAADPTIVNPARLPKDRSTMVCGQCHSFHKELDMTRWREEGVLYRAGDDIAETKGVFTYTTEPTHPRLLEHLKVEHDALAGRFWKDGTIRVAGREYTGLLESACHTEGEMTCLSCHAMHDYVSASDQLNDRDDDASCVRCHPAIAAQGTAHHHHPADSSGASCVNCHMPHTTWGLFTAMHSHRIDSPSATVSASTGRPNACNQCHVDQTLGWAADRLADWYDHPVPDLDADQRTLSATVLWLVRGDAAQRVLAAWTLGWPTAHEASGTGWQAPLLARALVDPYAVIRKTAAASLRTLPGFDDFEFDFVPFPQQQLGKLREAEERWRVGRDAWLDRRDTRVLLDEDGEQLADLLDELGRQRDDTPVRIIE